MRTVTSWLDRTFNFNFPADQYPKFITRLQEAPSRVADAVENVPRDILTAKRDGLWSMQETVGHLLDEEDLFWQRLQQYLAGAVSLAPAPYANHDMLHHNDEKIGDLLRAFAKARGRQVDKLLELEPEDFVRAAWHPRLRVKMRLVDHLYFIAEHDDHHLAHIEELREENMPTPMM